MMAPADIGGRLREARERRGWSLHDAAERTKLTTEVLKAIESNDFDRLPAGGRLVANAVTVESEAALAQMFSRNGGELRRFEYHRGEPLGGFTGWRPAMPVTQWSVTK